MSETTIEMVQRMEREFYEGLEADPTSAKLLEDYKRRKCEQENSKIL